MINPASFWYNSQSHLIEFNNHVVFIFWDKVIILFFVYTTIICPSTQSIGEKLNLLNWTKLAMWKSDKGGFGKKTKFLTSHDTKLAKAQCLGVEQLSGFLLSTLDSCLIIGEDEVFSECGLAVLVYLRSD